MFLNKTGTCLLAFALLSIGRSFAADDDFNANTAAAAVALQHYYNQKGLWDTTGWWNSANCVEAMENVIEANNGGNYLPVLANTLKRNAHAKYLNAYYDDEGWWALAWIRAYDLTGQPKYLKAAKIIFSDLTKGWSDQCGGGLVWRKTDVYKNAIPNELFLLAAIRLHQRTPGDGGAGSYFDWAIREWTWFENTGLINPHNLINDGLNKDCENNGTTTWTYNQGVILGGLTDLYKSTGDTNYLAQATAIADAVIATLVDSHGVLQEPCKDGNCHGGDVPQFKGIFIRYLAYLNDETHRATYLDFLQKNAQAVWANDRDDANHLGSKWDGPFDSADAARQSSAMMAVSALAEPMTENLPFCKGAGSVAFSHAVGAASGPLAWNCSPDNTTGAGLMLSGACAFLTAGKHVAHFRMAVDASAHSALNLVRLEVAESGSGKILARREIPWNAFAASGRSQDFPLAFTMVSDQMPLSLRVHWNQASGAPGLTLSDVTLDGFHNWTAANLAHEIGRLDGLNGWEADPVRDHISGCLVKGSGAQEFSAGKYSARFELKVDNFNLDESPVAALSVVDADTGKIVVSRVVTRNQFPDALYHVFTLNFKADPARHYDFQTFWHFVPQAPRLTQRSLVVQSESAP